MAAQEREGERSLFHGQGHGGPTDGTPNVHSMDKTAGTVFWAALPGGYGAAKLPWRAGKGDRFPGLVAPARLSLWQWLLVAGLSGPSRQSINF